MPPEGYAWDFFLAHAGPDAAVAEELFERLAPMRVFLDSRCLELGADWDRELAEAQRRSLITVVLVSSHTDDAAYQREEIAAAIDMARAGGGRHRVVPVYLGDAHRSGPDVPYGLRSKHGISLEEAGGLEEVARRLKELAERLEGWERAVVQPQRRVLSRLTARDAGSRLSGLVEVTRLFRPVVVALVAVLVLSVLLIFACLMMPSLARGVDRMLAVSVLAATCAIAMTFLMIVFMKSISVAQQIVQSGLPEPNEPAGGRHD